MSRDPEKAKARSKRHREKKKVEKYGPQAAGVNMSGRHGNHARGPSNGRWNDDRMISSHGYVLIRVGKSHPLAFGNGYAYEHDLVMVAYLARRLAPDEVVHHKNEVKTDNRIENLELLTGSEHMTRHNAERERDSLGKFTGHKKGGSPEEWPEDLRVRDFPAA
jgi:hypothetical protein